MLMLDALLKRIYDLDRVEQLFAAAIVVITLLEDLVKKLDELNLVESYVVNRINSLKLDLLQSQLDMITRIAQEEGAR